jgi:hypothetical protein
MMICKNKLKCKIQMTRYARRKKGGKSIHNLGRRGDVAHGELLLRVCVVCGNKYLGQMAVGRWGSIGKSST